MTDTSHPYGDGGGQGQSGSGDPGHGQDGRAPYGYDEVPPTSEPSADPFGSAPAAPSPAFGSAPAAPIPAPAFGSAPEARTSGAPADSAAPPTSASSAAPAPWGAAPAPAPWDASAAPAPWASSAPSAPAAPAGTPGTQPLSASQLGSVLGRLGIGNPLLTFAGGALAYVVALGAALVVILSAVLAMFTLDTGDLAGGAPDPTGGSASPSGGDGWRVIVGLVGIPFQLVSLATFGSYDVELNLGFLGSATMGWRGLPLLITVAMVTTAFVGARFAQRRWGSGRWGSNGVLGAFLWSGISGLAVAIFAVIATRVTAFAVEDASVGMSISMHAAGVDMFVGTWALIGLPLFLGHAAGMEKPAWWPLVADLAAAPRLALVHALAFAVPVGALLAVGGAIALALEGEASSVLTLLLALPHWGLSGLALLPGLGMLSVPVHVNLQGSVEELGLERTNEFLWFFDLPWYGWIPLVLIALLMPAVVALLWNRDREIVTGNVLALVASWLALPLAYAACSVVLLALVWTSMEAQMGMLGSIVVNGGLALWMPVVAFFLGVLVEVLARFGAPFVDRFVPGLLVNWFRRSARARRAAGARGPGATPPGQAPASPSFPGA
ncbi:hypothetical protein ACT3SP_15960 [Brachybacterium sp. AOP43-C2-M15]|uniref:hypothetical protein n=1 Tax=Brachybacterium sp. AOP43-C2-M15 TaxID=3457661 RepID=UPI004033F6AE